MNPEHCKSEYLEVFYALTTGTILKVGCSNGTIYAARVHVHNAHESLKEPTIIAWGNMVGVGNCIRFFHSDSGIGPITDEYVPRPREITDLNTLSRGERDSSLPVVALFLDETDARLASTKQGFHPASKHWDSQTLEVIRTIGVAHPYFAVSCERMTRLVDPIEWLPPEHVAQLPEYRYPRT